MWRALRRWICSDPPPPAHPPELGELEEATRRMMRALDRLEDVIAKRAPDFQPEADEYTEAQNMVLRRAVDWVEALDA